MRCDLRYDVVVTITSSSGSNSTGYIVLLRVVGVTVEIRVLLCSFDVTINNEAVAAGKAIHRDPASDLFPLRDDR